VGRVFVTVLPFTLTLTETMISMMQVNKLQHPVQPAPTLGVSGELGLHP